MTKGRIIGSAVAALLIVGVVAGFAIAWRPAIAAIEQPQPQSFDAALVKRGRELAAIGNCSSCHTARGGRDFAGGVPVPTPFGTIYSSNITPDAETGIGRWPEAAFRRAMRSGVDRSGQHLYPTFPYDHFTNVSDEDDRALYAFLMTRQPVHAPARVNQLSFPLDQRVVIAGWKLLFLRHGTYQPDTSTERGMESRRLSGRRAGALRRVPHPAQCARRGTRAARPLPVAMSTTGSAYAINAQSPAPVPWDAAALFAYLRDGWHPDHGVARGPMADVVSNLSIGPGQRYPRHRELYGQRVRRADAGSQAPGRGGAGAGQVASGAGSQDRCGGCVRSTPRPARPATRRTGRCPMAGSTSRSPPPSAPPMRATPPTSYCRAFARSRASAARSCRALPPA